MRRRANDANRSTMRRNCQSAAADDSHRAGVRPNMVTMPCIIRMSLCDQPVFVSGGTAAS